MSQYTPEHREPSVHQQAGPPAAGRECGGGDVLREVESKTRHKHAFPPSKTHMKILTHSPNMETHRPVRTHTHTHPVPGSRTPAGAIQQQLRLWWSSQLRLYNPFICIVCCFKTLSLTAETTLKSIDSLFTKKGKKPPQKFLIKSYSHLKIGIFLLCWWQIPEF